MKSNKIKFKIEYSDVRVFLKPLKPTYQNDTYKVYVFGNQRFSNLFESKNLDVQEFKQKAFGDLEYGLVFLVQNNCIEIYNDVFGAYPLFINDENEYPIFSNYFELTNESELDVIAIIQFIHFNHTLGTHTLTPKTKRVSGASKITINPKGYKKERILDWPALETILFKDDYIEKSKKSWSYLESFIADSKKPNNKDILTLTGGFDSRLIMGIMLNKSNDFSTITWGQNGNLQTETAKKISKKYSIDHIELELEEKFRKKIKDYLNFIITNGSESPFIIDVPPFIYMCENLKEGTNLISGIMGSEIIRGPSCSSQVTLTKFAANISLAKTEKEIEIIIRQFQRDYPFINDEVMEGNINELIDCYKIYSKIGKNKKNKNVSTFRYLFLEKYPKIFGPIIKFHQDQNINLINPFMSIDFIKKMLNENKAMTKLRPFEGKAFYNYELYKYYAHALEDIYPDLNNTRVDRGYKIKNLISKTSIIRLALYQVYRKYIRKKINQKVPTVDSKKWFYSVLTKNKQDLDQRLLSILNKKTLENSIHKDSFHSIKSQLILGLNEKMKYSKDLRQDV